MEKKKAMLKIVALYREFFEKEEIAKKGFVGVLQPEIIQVLEYCHKMLNEIEQLIQEGQMDEANRAIGFIQGCLCSVGMYTIEELAEHSKSLRPPRSTQPRQPRRHGRSTLG